MLLHGQSVGHRLPFVFTFEISCSCANAWFPPMFNTIFGCFTVYSILMLLFASVVPSPQWSVSSWLSFGIYTLIAFPRSTNQWSFLGLNFWPNQSVEKPSNEFDLIGNPISKGKFSRSAVSCFFCVHRFPETFHEHRIRVFAPGFSFLFESCVGFTEVFCLEWDAVEKVTLRSSKRMNLYFLL